MGRFIHKLKKSLDTIMAPAEDPRLTYAQTCERQRALLARVQAALLEISAAKERLEAKAADIKTRMPQLEEQARRSLRDRREDLARLALQRYQLVASEFKQLEVQLGEIVQEEHRLRMTEQRLSAQIEAFYNRLDLVAARYSAAEAQIEISEAMTGVTEELAELGRAMEQAELKSEYMQARAAAIDRLVEDSILELPGSASQTADLQLAPPEIDKIVESHLLALKSELDETRLD